MELGTRKMQELFDHYLAMPDHVCHMKSFAAQPLLHSDLAISLLLHEKFLSRQHLLCREKVKQALQPHCCVCHQGQLLDHHYHRKDYLLRWQPFPRRSSTLLMNQLFMIGEIREQFFGDAPNAVINGATLLTYGMRVVLNVRFL